MQGTTHPPKPLPWLQLCSAVYIIPLIKIKKVTPALHTRNESFQWVLPKPPRV